MAVITRYIVERNGEEKMTFVSKKDADAYDKELDIAENLQALLEESEIEMSDGLLEDISLFLARNKDAAGLILKGSKPKKASSEKEEKGDKKNAKLAAVDSETVNSDAEDQSDVA